MRLSLALLPLSLFLTMPAFAVDGVDLPGKDYRRFPAPTAALCRHSCGGEDRCQAYTWVKPGVQEAAAICYLKHTEPAIVRNSCCDSAPRRFITERDLTWEDKVDRPGSDYKNFATTWTKGWEECKVACTGEDICRSWSYVRKGVQGVTGRCWLKNKVAAPVVNPNTVSGVKFVRPAQRIDPG